MPVNTRLQIRRGTFAEWTGVVPSPTIYAGEMAWETDTGRVKIGPPGSTTAWEDIPYSFITIEDPSNPGSLNGLTTQSGVALIGLTGVNGHVTGIQIDGKLTAGTDIGLSVQGDGSIVVSYTGDASLNPSNPQQVEIIQDIIGSGDHLTTGFIRQASGISIVYDDNGTGGSGTLTFGLTGLLGVSGVSTSYSNDRWEVSANLTSGSGIEITDVAGAKKITATGLSLEGHTHSINDIEGLDGLSVTNNSISGLNNLWATGTISGLNVQASNSGTFGYLQVNNTANIDSDLTVGGTVSVTGSVTSPLFIGDLQGTALTSSGVMTVDSGDSASNHYLTFVDGNNSNLETDTVYTDSSIVYNPSTNTLDLPNINVASTGTIAELDVTGSATVGSNLNVGGYIATTGNVTVGGDLVVKGTTTTVNSTTVDIGDNIIRVNASGLGTGGFEVKVSGTTDYKSLIWNTSTDRWEFSGGENVYTSGDISGNTLISTISGPDAPLVIASTGFVDNLNVDLLDNQEGSWYLDFDNATNLPSPTGTGSLSGHISGTMTVDTLDNLGREGDYWSVVFANTTINSNVITSGMIQNGQIYNSHIASDAAIEVTKLASSGIELGQPGTLSTIINLGENSSTIDGLTRISGVSAANPIYLHYAVIDGGSP